MAKRGAAAAIAVAAGIGCATAAVVDRRVTEAVAAVGRGSEDAFATGLQRRELPVGRGPQRWTSPRAALRFVDVPAGRRAIEIAIHGQQSDVAVALDGRMHARILPGARSLAIETEATERGALNVELITEGFQAGDGRRLGAMFDRVVVRHPVSALPSQGLLLRFGGVSALVAAAALLSGTTPRIALALATCVSVLHGTLLSIHGLLRSPYAWRLAGLFVLGTLFSALAARLRPIRAHDATRFAYPCLLLAWVVHCIAGTSPVMVASDAVFHANKLSAVAFAGDLFPTSVTQHTPPFRIPYGVTFYAVLAPFARLHFDLVLLVRWGAALAGFGASLVFFVWRLSAGRAKAALAVALLALLPGAFDIAYSHGNFSNAFGQAVTVAFFAWWLGGARAGPLTGGLLLGAAALSHLSSFIVLCAVVPFLLWARRGERRSRGRSWAVAIGAAIAAAYYATFAPLVGAQLPRLLEGVGAGTEQTAPVAALVVQALRLAGQWGVPAILLAAIGWPRGDADEAGDLSALWLGGCALLGLAAVSPLEVRYAYALAPAAAIAGAGAVADLWRAGRARRIVVAVLVAVQLVLAATRIAEAMFHRYR